MYRHLVHTSYRQLSRWEARFFATGPDHLNMIKALREQTGAPISDVKEALKQANWNSGKEPQITGDRSIHLKPKCVHS